jgi:biotin carboxyl carrier protein
MQWQKVVVREKDRDIEVLIAVERENVFRVKIGEREYIVEMTPKGVFAARLPKEASGKQEVIVTSEVPGRVVEVFVKEGDAINEGDLIAIVESMKMEIEITSPRRGIVEKVYVVRGSFVREGNALVKLRAE